MAISAPINRGEGFERELVPAGNHVARVYSIIHIGTIEDEYMGERKQVNKVRIGFELPEELRVFGEKGELPMVISQEYTLSMHEKAKLRQLVEGMLGSGFELPEEAEAFDVSQLMGTACLLNVVHRKSQAGKEYDNIASAAPLPKGMEAPAAINEPFLLDYDNWSDERMETLPDFIKVKILSSYQYRNMKGLVTQEGIAQDIAVRDPRNNYPQEDINPDKTPF